MEGISLASQDSCRFKLIYDDYNLSVRCLARIVRAWDRCGHFQLIPWTDSNPANTAILNELETRRWSLVLLDSCDTMRAGPDAIPFIFKNLPFGRMVAALFILPGTMWITQRIYRLLSRFHRQFA